MSQIPVSRSAIAVAFARAYHACNDAPLIFDDSLARPFFSDEQWRINSENIAGALRLVDPAAAAAGPDLATALKQVVQTFSGSVTLSRSRFAEDALAQAIAAGIGQYVLLGAGFDTYAFRARALDAPPQVFELDTPVTQDYKRRRLDALGWEIPPWLHFVPVDFTRTDAFTALAASPYRADAPSFVSWLGVSYYLPPETLFSALSGMAAGLAPGSSLVFDFLDPGAFATTASHRMQLTRFLLGRDGEPMLTAIDPDRLAALLAQVGLRLQEQLDPGQIDRRYFSGRTDSYRAFEHFHFARVLRP